MCGVNIGLLATEDAGNLGGRAAEDESGGVNDEPAVLDVLRLCRKGLLLGRLMQYFDCGWYLASPVRNATRVSAATKGCFWTDL